MTARFHVPIPPGPFRVAEGLRAGLTPDRLRGDELHRPHHGVRTATPVEDDVGFCRAFVPRLRRDQALTGPSAAHVYGLPLPARLHGLDTVHVAVADPATPPRARTVRGTRIRPDLWRVVRVSGMPLTSPFTTWITLARWLDVDELTEAADALVTRSTNYPGLVGRRPYVGFEALRRRVAGLRGLTAVALLREAALRARPGVESPLETRLRRRLVAAGFPEPEVGGAVAAADGRTLHGDLVYRDERVILEYEGDVHRERTRFRRDITRGRRLRGGGWHVIRVTIDDLGGPAFAELCRDLAKLVPRGPAE
ncbi:hypothetical protein F8O01_07800 [Pseudoclavibacter chungangensis]|uniref:DUF559 domain-containing protein n=1 Tax=Pseudoclavibacter chungangensis TaxID=587635 RepID=A0A7J5BU19_9MICO|nr:hypothetical protein [Pseudoclavibacter chungangensis]KAB1657838.1 hypothetical protein F8O01_07800 [Pseudoclavibacter chungangensis]NYJ66562.1 hypothetical protein [Pseudoclavibacter chungangensis]